MSNVISEASQFVPWSSQFGSVSLLLCIFIQLFESIVLMKNLTHFYVANIRSEIKVYLTFLTQK